MPCPLRKTAAILLKMTPEVRYLWEQCAVAESHSLTNIFEVMVHEHTWKLNIPVPTPAHAVAVAGRGAKRTMGNRN